jgi:hypothetical protein
LLFRHAAGGGIELTEDPASAPICVPFDFAHVSGVRWCGERGELLATASETEQGEPRLFARRLDREWRQIGTSFADDPVATADRYVVSSGNGIAVLGEDGSVLHEHRQGRANGAPPSLSISRDGTYLAWVRWKGDDKKLCVLDLSDNRVTESSQSLYRYAWLDDRRLVFLLGGPPRVLEAASGETQQFLPGRYHDVTAAGDQVWLTSDVRDSIVRRAGKASDEVWREQRSVRDRVKRESRRVGCVVPLADGSAWVLLDVYRGPYTTVRREELWLGPLADRAAGWRPLLDCHQPEFGFLMPFDGR